MMANKSDKRLESKKRKAAAFLNLVKSEQNEDSNKQVDVNANPDGSAEKKQKLDSAVNVSNEGEGKASTDTTAHKPENGKPQTADEMLAEYKRMLKERQKKSMERPKLFLTLDELTRDFPDEIVTELVKETPPLFMTDIQNLLLFSLQGSLASYKPRWCQLLRQSRVSKVIAVVVDSLSKDEFDNFADHLPTLKSAFDIKVNIVPPAQYGSSVREELLNVPFSLRFLQNKLPDIKKETFNRIKNSIKQHTGCSVGVRDLANNKPSEDPPSSEALVSTVECKFDRRLLMLSPEQMIREGIPMPYNDDTGRYERFTYSKSCQYKPVSNTSPLFAVDCEMVQTSESRMDLARVSIVNENLETVYDTYVKPRAKVINYVTQFSGVTKEILATVNTRVEDVQKKVDSLLPSDAILCGQSIGGDLRSMKVFHPYLIDTSVIYNLTGNRNIKTGLKKLAENFLSKSIQEDTGKGHSSVEDAMATMELVLLKLKKDISFGDYAHMSLGDPENHLPVTSCGDAVVSEMRLETPQQQAMRKRRLFFQQERQRYSETFQERLTRGKQTGVIVDEAESQASYPEPTCVLTCPSDKLREKQTSHSCQEADFCMTHLYGYRDFLSACSEDQQPTEEERQKCLWKLDRRVWKILKTAPPKSVFTVILTGRQDGNRFPQAMAFAKVV